MRCSGTKAISPNERLFVSDLTYALHFGTFSGLMAATVAGLLNSLATGAAKRLIGYIDGNTYYPGVFFVDPVEPSRISRAGDRSVGGRCSPPGVSGALYSQPRLYLSPTTVVVPDGGWLLRPGAPRAVALDRAQAPSGS